MKLDNTSEFASWVIDLRDGELQIQRMFKFHNKSSLNGFMDEVGRTMERSSLSVAIDFTQNTEMAAVVTMNVIPERVALAAAGDIASQLERSFAQVADLLRFAA